MMMMMTMTITNDDDDDDDDNNNNKCIGDDTKAAACQSLNCIKNKKIKCAEKTIFNMPDGILTPCNVARSRHSFAR